MILSLSRNFPRPAFLGFFGIFAVDRRKFIELPRISAAIAAAKPYTARLVNAAEIAAVH
jgi:hypothetical protein